MPGGRLAGGRAGRGGAGGSGLSDAGPGGAPPRPRRAGGDAAARPRRDGPPPPRSPARHFPPRAAGIPPPPGPAFFRGRPGAISPPRGATRWGGKTSPACRAPRRSFSLRARGLGRRSAGRLEAALPAALEIRRELPAPVRVRQALPPAPPAPAPRARAPRPGAHQPLAHGGLVAVGAPPDPGRRPALLPPHARVRPVALPGVRLSPPPAASLRASHAGVREEPPARLRPSRRGRAAGKAPARRRPRPYST